MQRYLKIKIKSLAAEARFIRNEERKVLSHANYCRQAQGLDAFGEEHERCYVGLRNHRTVVVRDAARETFLAYAYLRGRELSHCERHTPPAWLVNNALKMVKKYAPNPFDKGLEQAFKAWCGVE